MRFFFAQLLQSTIAADMYLAQCTKKNKQFIASGTGNDQYCYP
jgi:hypothetical protein